MKSIKADPDSLSTVDTADVLCPVALQKLQSIVGENNEVFIELIDMFLEDAPGFLDDIRRAVASCAPADLRLAAHSLKSNSAEFGATALSELCRELEMMGKEENLAGACLADARKKANQAERLYQRVQAALIAMRETLAGQAL